MTRLELIMSDSKTLTADDARALLSDHVEGTLDAPVRAELDALLASDPALAAERASLARTIDALHALPAPDAPADMVAKVRDRLAKERRDAQAPADAPMAQVIAPTRFRWGGIEAAIGLAAAASVAVFIGVIGMPQSGGAPGTQTAGFGEATALVTATFTAPGFTRAELDDAAGTAGMTRVAEGYEGDRRSAARFVVALKATAVVKGVEISGMIPEADRVHIDVKTGP